jgi:hypothetical protein
MNENQAVILSADIAPPALLDRAVASGASVEVLERLMGLQERWQANQAKRAFDNAMAALRMEMPPIIKNQSVDFTSNRGRTHYKYEDLADISEALTPAMAKHGLSFRWRTQPGEPVTVTCIVSHRDGHSEECALSAPRDESGNKNPIQSLGSAITYLQRYTLKAALGVAAARDDDGQAAGKQPGRAPDQEPKQREYPLKPAEPVKPTAKTRSWMVDQLSQFSVEDLLKFAKSEGFVIATLEEWPLDHVPTSKAALAELIRKIEDWMALHTVKPEPTKPEPDFAEPFWQVKVTVPRAGQKKVEYLQNPDFIGSLYEEGTKKGDDTARKRLWGLAKSWNPGTWIDNNGEERQPNEEDVKLREALDQFLEWEENRK